MRSPPLPLVLLLAITIATNGIVFSLDPESLSSGWILHAYACVVLLISQSGLLASWFVLGTTNLLIRLGTVTICVLLVMHAWASRLGYFSFFPIAIAEFVVVIALIATLRIARFQWAAPNATSDLKVSRLQQFTLRDLLAWTTVIAVVVFALRRNTTMWDNHFGPDLSMLFIWASVLAVLSMLPLVLAVPRVSVLLPTAIVLLIAGITGGLLADSSEKRWVLVMLFVASSLIQCIWILTARTCGYRLMRSQRRAAADTPKPPEMDPWSTDAES